MTKSYYQLDAERRQLQSELDDAVVTVAYWMKRYEHVAAENERLRRQWAYIAQEQPVDEWSKNLGCCVAQTAY